MYDIQGEFDLICAGVAICVVHRSNGPCWRPDGWTIPAADEPLLEQLIDRSLKNAVVLGAASDAAGVFSVLSFNRPGLHDRAVHVCEGRMQVVLYGEVRSQSEWHEAAELQRVLDVWAATHALPGHPEWRP